METFPVATVPSTLHNVDFMVKNTKRMMLSSAMPATRS